MIKAEDFIIVTGAAGFIGSCMVGYLNRQGIENIIMVDDFTRADKEPNYSEKKFSFKIQRENLFQWLEDTKIRISFIYHLGARTDTTEFDYNIHQRLNVEYSMQVWQYCVVNNVPLIFASSAATYGSGELGYDDDHSFPEKL